MIIDYSHDDYHNYDTHMLKSHLGHSSSLEIPKNRLKNQWGFLFMKTKSFNQNPVIISNPVLNNIATGETSQAITPFHFYDYFRFSNSQETTFLIV